ncbi:XRE family transcriptional regulator [Nocardia abscessus]|uniref:XRE family transcriptional regulator n=1 Tax=Nocardia abscessus TaxID=120957 RepID=UPI0024572498|nr:XRE family transcriptional regulator [Nocardia abscessus]
MDVWEVSAMSGESVFWDDLADDLQDPEFLREFVLESIRVKTVDAIVNALDHARAAASLSKAELARAAAMEPAAARRLLGAGSVNPTLRTVSELAAALGLRLTLEPLGSGGKALSTALVSGKVDDLAELKDAVEQFDRG